MAPRSIPEDGDIIVREEKRERKIVLVLHTAPGADQYRYDFVLLKDFRAAKSL